MHTTPASKSHASSKHPLSQYIIYICEQLLYIKHASHAVDYHTIPSKPRYVITHDHTASYHTSQS